MHFFKTVVLLIFVFGGASLSFGQKKKSKQPNIVFIMSDDHGYQAISSYGFGLNHTPNLDKIGNEGIRFERAFVNNSLCAPSRASIISAKFSSQSSVRQIGDRFDGAQTTFPKELQKAGYQTAFLGKWHLFSTPTGFDYWKRLPGQGDYYQPDFIHENGETIREEGYVTDIITDDALKWLDERDPEKPFSILIWHKAPHRNWMPALRHLDLFNTEDIPEPETMFDDYATRTRAAHEQKMEMSKWLAPNYDLKTNLYADGSERYDDMWNDIFNRLTNAEKKAFEEAYDMENHAFKQANLEGEALTRWKYQRYMKDYLRTIQSIDDNVGRVLDYLKENDLEDNTIVIYTSDQGFYLGEHGWFDKRFMYEESFRTPLLIRWPEVIESGMVSNEKVMNLDIGTMLLDAAGAEIPSDMHGQSFLPVLNGENPTGGRKYIYYHYYDAGGEHNVAKHLGIRSDEYKLIYFYENKEWELYDLTQDPNELNNVYGQETYKDVQANLLKQLKIEMEKAEEEMKI